MIAQLWLMQPHGWARAELPLIGIFSEELTLLFLHFDWCLQGVTR